MYLLNFCEGFREYSLERVQYLEFFVKIFSLWLQMFTEDLQMVYMSSAS